MIVLAQVPGDELGGFLAQPFVGPVLSMICFFGILLILVVAALVYVRGRKAQAARESIPPPLGYVPYDVGGQDMPDLDLLVNTAGMSSASASAAPAPARVARKGAFQVEVSDGDAAEAVEVLTILRDVMDGRLIVQMGDKAYQNPSSNPEFKERFNKLMRELGQTVARPAPDAAPQPAPDAPDEPMTLSDLIPPSEPAQPLQPPPAPKPRVAPPPVSSSGPLPGDLPSFKLADNPVEKRKRGQKQEIKPVPEVNIAGAIEAYLQYKLRHTGEFTNRSIHIYPSPDGGVSIEVDGSYYDAVGDIDDADVREFIATAIQEWQERH
jgi:hypothetical protein